MDLAVNLADQYSIKIFSEKVGHPEPIIIIIIRKCPKLLRIYGNQEAMLSWLKNISNSLLAGLDTLNFTKIGNLSRSEAKVINNTLNYPKSLPAQKG